MAKKSATRPAPVPTPRISTTLAECFTAEPALAGLLTQRHPVKLAYHLAKLYKRVCEEARHFALEREKYIKELGAERDATPKEREEGSPARVFEVLQEHRDTYATRVTELSAIEVTIEWGPVPLEAFETMTGDELVKLEAFIVPATSICPWCGHAAPDGGAPPPAPLALVPGK